MPYFPAKNLVLLPATAADIPTLVNIYFKSFTTFFRRRAFPDTPYVREWWEKSLRKEIQNDHALFLKVVEPKSTLGIGNNPEGPIIAWAQWKKPKELHKGDGQTLPAWPKGADVLLCEQHFGDLTRKHHELMRERPHWYLELLATDPKHQKRGAGSVLLRHILANADATGHETYLEAPPHAAPIYRKFGFKERDKVDVNVQVDSGTEVYRNWCMVREPGAEQGR
ncbi:acyl-CoA N-acyltransferase [Glonium stellatum]|uniref:Acyl-CoA N-acyltransferase n=1 Tax=Glonium stellatum TaxID=574774 RepID=A0A8E2JPT3_9PEZI|nr:acyl-CoA N-acyltransferase [Glonium stellatum]